MATGNGRAGVDTAGSTSRFCAAGQPWRTLLVTVSAVLLAVMALEQFELTWHFPVTRGLMQTQDIPVLIGVSALFLAMWGGRIPAGFGQWATMFAANERAGIVVLVLGAGLIAAFGTALVVAGHTWTFDEYMAWFDARVFAKGHLLAPVPAEWRAYVPALVPHFRLPVPANEAWISSYLPGNAAIRALLGLALNEALINAALVVAALAALVGVTRQLWPERPDARIIAVVLAATSSQVLCMAMSPWAMSAHLTLNLVWLWLFLRGKPASHAGAIVVGFVATGLHQIIFHPLFVAPFLLQLLFDRRWRLGLVYAASYAAIGIFWILYWQFLLAGFGAKPDQASAVGLPFLLSRVAAMLAIFNASGFETMLQNLLRFAAWQNPLMLLLLVPGIVAAWRGSGAMRSLLAGIVLTLIAMLVLLPYQDTGWGYRYVHGLVGSAALIGALGWIQLSDRSAPTGMAAAWGIAAITTAVALFLLLPVHVLQMRTKIGPYAAAAAAIRAKPTEAVVIETVTIYYGDDLVRNDPYLRNRPLIFDIGQLDEKLLRELCARMTVSVFDGKDGARYGIITTDATVHPEYERIRKLRQLAESAECRELRRGG